MFEIKVFESKNELIETLAEQLMAVSYREGPVHIALSGGSTPIALYDFIVGSELREAIQWQNLQFWWGDERMVPSSDDESNYGEALRHLFQKVDIPLENLHPINGAESREAELSRLDSELASTVASFEGRPCFDWIILGMGNDGHTASLFPGQVNYEAQENWVSAEHPETKQPRISLSAETLCNAKQISFIVTGSDKSEIVPKVFADTEEADVYPAANIFAFEGETQWLLDPDAARLLVEE